jgi:propanediol dehydratase large subunit
MYCICLNLSSVKKDNNLIATYDSELFYNGTTDLAQMKSDGEWLTDSATMFHDWNTVCDVLDKIYEINPQSGYQICRISGDRVKYNTSLSRY